jgi:hydrogenase maturation protein HypF
MPGGAAAIREPWRMAVSYLAHHFGPDFLKLQIPFVRQLARPKVEFLLRMMEKNVNSPLTSSCGRLFDAVAALAGIRPLVNYEAQAAIELEMAMERSESRSIDPEDAYPLQLLPDGEGWILATGSLFAALLADVETEVPVATISRRFHDGLVEGFAVKLGSKDLGFDSYEKHISGRDSEQFGAQQRVDQRGRVRIHAHGRTRGA